MIVFDMFSAAVVILIFSVVFFLIVCFLAK